MKEEKEYLRDISEIRSMMQRSSKFLSLSGWAGVMAGIYALVGAYIAYKFFYMTPAKLSDDINSGGFNGELLSNTIITATIILLLSISTAIYLSSKNAARRGEKIWNVTARLVVMSMGVPLVTGGILILIFIAKGLLGLIIPSTLIFYGLALFNASKYTYEEVKSLGLIQIAFGLLSTYFTGYGLLFWSLGFGVIHIVYGIYMHYKYEK